MRFQEALRGATIGRPVRIERVRFVIPAGYKCTGSSKAVCQKVFAEQVVLIDAIAKIAVERARELEQPYGLDGRAGYNDNLAGHVLFLTAGIEIVNAIHLRPVALETRHDAVAANLKVRKTGHRTEKRDPGARLESKRIAVAIDKTGLGFLRIRHFAVARLMVSGDHRERSPVGLNRMGGVQYRSQRLHSLECKLTDRIGIERRLVRVRLGEWLLLICLLAVQSDELFRLAIVRLHVVVADRPISSIAFYVIARVARQGWTAGIKRLQPEIQRSVPQGSTPIMLRSPADDLCRVAFYRRAIRPVRRAVNVRLVVQVGLHMARIERGAGISEARQSKALLHAVGDQFVPLEAATLICALILRPDQRPFFKDQHRFACLGHFVRNRCSTTSTSDNNNVKIRFHDWSLAQIVGTVAERFFDSVPPLKKRLPTLRIRVSLRQIGPSGTGRVTAVLGMGEGARASMSPEKVKEKQGALIF